MALESNIEDMNNAIEQLTDMQEPLSEVLNDDFVDCIGRVISEWSNHLKSDAEEAVERLNDLETDLEDVTFERDELERRLADRDEELDIHSDEIARLKRTIAALEEE